MSSGRRTQERGQSCRDWSHAEDMKLMQIYGSYHDGGLSKVFHRSEHSIRSRARHFCLAKDKGYLARRRAQGFTTAVARMPRWTEAEVALLRRIYADQSALEVARRLGRSTSSVTSKARLLRLKKTPERLSARSRENIKIRYPKK